MRAVLLAAGVGRRLGQDRPKCLLEVGGRTLLDRHLDILAALEVPVRIVTGFHAEMLAPVAGEAVELVHNDAFQRGSLLSLVVGLNDLEDDVLIMDADVLYDPTILRDVAALSRGFAVDPRTDPGEEEMMIGVQDGKARAIRRGRLDGFELVGEGVGFFKIDRDALPTLRSLCDACDPDGDYEHAVDRFVEAHGADYVLVAGRAWTEIDFPEDLAHAEQHVLPTLG